MAPAHGGASVNSVTLGPFISKMNPNGVRATAEISRKPFAALVRQNRTGVRKTPEKKFAERHLRREKCEKCCRLRRSSWSRASEFP